MNQYIVTIPSSINGVEGFDITNPSIPFKGPFKLIIDLKDVNIGNNKVINVKLNFGDINNTLDDIDEDYIFTDERPNFDRLFEHVYQPSDTNIYYKIYKATLSLTFSNLNVYKYIFDVRVYKESFYSSHKKIEIISGQFVDNMNDSMFLVCNNLNGDKFNVIVK